MPTTNAPQIGKVLPLYADAFFRHAEAEVWGTTEEALRAGDAAGPKHLFQVLRIPPQAYFRHPLYSNILRPAGAHTFMRSMICNRGALVGTCSIGRTADDKDFTESELQALRRVEPFLALALASRRTPQHSELSTDGSAIVITDRTGKVRWQSLLARSLLSLAQGSTLAAPVLPEGILCAVRSLVRIAQGDSAAAVPLWQTANAWGSFSARAYWLEPEEPAESLIAIALERKVPRSLRLIEGLARHRLTPQQREVGHLLAQGQHEQEIARRLHLKGNTVVYHRRQLYSRLEVANRAQLVDRLLEPSPALGLKIRLRRPTRRCRSPACSARSSPATVAPTAR